MRWGISKHLAIFFGFTNQKKLNVKIDAVMLNISVWLHNQKIH